MKLEERYYVGSKHKTNEGYVAEVIEKFPKDLRKIRFNDTYNTEILTYGTNLGKGYVSNPNHRSVCGVGYFGIGKYVSSSSRVEDIRYKTWINMINRVYNKSYHEYRPTYSTVTVCENWHNYQNFAEWYDNSFPLTLIENKMQMDKDLLQQGIQNKIYSPKTVVWIPTSINTYITKQIESGVFWYEKKKRWTGYCSEFKKRNKVNLGSFKDKKSCSDVVKEFKLLQDIKARQFVRDLNYLPEEIIQLIKTV